MLIMGNCTGFALAAATFVGDLGSLCGAPFSSVILGSDGSGPHRDHGALAFPHSPLLNLLLLAGRHDSRHHGRVGVLLFYAISRFPLCELRFPP